MHEWFICLLPTVPLSHILETSGLGVTHPVDYMHTILCGVLVTHLHVLLRPLYLDCCIHVLNIFHCICWQ